ncbi:hypothetical protein PP175_27850 (plasmid) [Aneurinibacillus sp. Ricciae_BoGa-3]|uniref:hypothetical protein n=1 Tax=Aneurinibacillus sp. Ricciae_BoGa-3 TaxID=3022697 RepID=UPI00233F7CC7|nr:hypothetical protein [Aneurinibacillus sp. Ricciae_BoGa-3]WCK57007.1 hypothetical protein PP175_27850 [Aneurinibacillus sp. Ricciae_BoGa-3]
MVHKESNRQKSIRGHSLNRKVGDLLKSLQANHIILSFKPEPRYAIDGYTYQQFSPDFELHLPNGIYLIIDNTNTIRHDRLKQKQWDAYGVKQSLKAKNRPCRYIVLVPDKDIIGTDNSREKEIVNVEREKEKISGDAYLSIIDDIIYFSELEMYIQQLSSIVLPTLEETPCRETQRNPILL